MALYDSLQAVLKQFISQFDTTFNKFGANMFIPGTKSDWMRAVLVLILLATIAAITSGFAYTMQGRLGKGDDDLGEDELGEDELGEDELGEDELGEDELGEDELGEDELGEDELGEDELGEDELGEDELGEYYGTLDPKADPMKDPLGFLGDMVGSFLGKRRKKPSPPRRAAVRRVAVRTRTTAQRQAKRGAAVARRTARRVRRSPYWRFFFQHLLSVWMYYIVFVALFFGIDGDIFSLVPQEYQSTIGLTDTAYMTTHGKTYKPYQPPTSFKPYQPTASTAYRPMPPVPRF